jgi:hypothetical protein
VAFPTDSPEAVAARPVLKAPVEVLTAFDVVAMARNCRSTGGYGHGAIRDKNDRGSRLDVKRFLRT